MKNVPDNHALALALIENIQREDLNPLEEAVGLARLIEEFGLTHEAAAKAVGKSRSAVTNLLRLTHLAKPAQEYLMSGALEMGHARALLALPAAQQTVTAARVVNGQLSVRETERLVATLAAPAKRARAQGGPRRTRRRHRAARDRAGREARRCRAHRTHAQRRRTAGDRLREPRPARRDPRADPVASSH